MLAAAILARRIDDLTHLPEIQPDQIALRAVVDDDGARTKVRVGIEGAAAARTGEAPMQFRPIERHRIHGRRARPGPPLRRGDGEGGARQQDAAAPRAEIDRVLVVEQRVRHRDGADRTLRRVRRLADDTDAPGFDGLWKVIRTAVAAAEVATRFDQRHRGAAVRTVHRLR